MRRFDRLAALVGFPGLLGVAAPSTDLHRPSMQVVGSPALEELSRASSLTACRCRLCRMPPRHCQSPPLPPLPLPPPLPPLLLPLPLPLAVCHAHSPSFVAAPVAAVASTTVTVFAAIAVVAVAGACPKVCPQVPNANSHRRRPLWP